MSLTRWLTLRQARDALSAGQLDAARRHLAPYLRTGHRGALDIARQLSKSYRFRAEKALRNDNPEAAWKDLLIAEDLPNNDAELAQLRSTLTKLGVAECRAALAAGRAMFVVERLSALKLRRAFHPEFDPLELAAKNALLAQEQADRGEFDAALAGAPTPRVKADYARRAQAVQATLPLFAESLSAQRWTEALQHATTILNAAPNHREARAGKAKAWDALQPIQLTAAEDDRPTQPGFAGVRASARQTSASEDGLKPELQQKQIPIAQTVNVSPGIPRRFLLWIDGVGGYLICTGPRVAFGQATNRGPVDVPLFADVSRLHAEIHRDGEGYVLESGHNIAVNGTSAKRTVLKPEDRITFGSTCQMLFQQPVPISPTAKLELVSGHRLPVAVDAIWLMAENLVMAPSAPAHILIPDLPAPAVLFRSKQGLSFRCAGKFRVDGEPHDDRAILRVPCHVSAEHLSFALEPLAAKG
jgi:hypothetical protein